MKTIKTLEQILGEPCQSVQIIETGLTNKNFHVSTPRGDFVVRIPRVENHGMFDYAQEYRILMLLKPLSIDVPLKSYDTGSGIKVTTYIPNASTFELQYLEAATTLIKVLHTAQLHCGTRYDILASFTSYTQEIDAPAYDLSVGEKALHFVAQYEPQSWILCHNDLVAGNFLFSADRNYLIDYEYAADNHPYFDLMSFITENDIVDANARHTIYTLYFDATPTPAQMFALNQFEIALNTLWCAWALMMHQRFGEEIYDSIAKLKYRRLLEAIKKTHI